MKTKVSRFLVDNKVILKQIVDVLSKEFKYVSILGVDTISNIYTVNSTTTSVGDADLTEKGFVVRVYNGVNYSEYSFDQIISPNDVVASVREIAYNDVALINSSNIDLIEFPVIEEEGLVKNFNTEVEIDPFSISTDDKINKLIELKKKGLSMNDKFIDFRVSFQETLISKVFISTNKDLEQSILFTTMSALGIGRNEQGIKYDFQSASGLKGYEIFDEIESRLQVISDNVNDLFKAERVVPGNYEIICDPDVSGLIAHEAFGHGVEMDMFVKNRAKGAEYINKEIASLKTNMRDGAQSAVEVGTYLFDDEGTIGTDTVVIDNGVLVNGISDVLSALKLGTHPTGNGRRESFERKAYARMTNTFFENGEDTVDDMIKATKKGYLLEGYFSGMEDPKNWGIQCVLAKGREIINGEFTGKIISPVTLTGYVPDLLKAISMVSKDDVCLTGSGACGKGHKEWVKVSCGGSHIKTIGRLS